MRTALVLLFLLALASVPGLGPAAAGHRPRRGHPVLRRRTRRWPRSWTGCRCSTCSARPGSRRSTCCCSLRWPAACCRGRSGCARSARQPPPRAPRTWHGCRWPPATGPPGRRTARWLEPRRPARPPPVPAAHRRRLGVGGEGLPARGRQPALPRGPARPAGLGGARRAVRLQGQPAADRAARPSPTRRWAWTSSGPAAWSPPATCSRSSITLSSFSAQLRHLRACSAASRSSYAARSGTAAAGRTVRSYDLRVNSPADRRRRAGLPDRPRLRAGVQGHRRHRPGALRPARCRSSRSSSPGLPRRA